ncbi:MAG TPA: tetratricopeptide repeat protein [Nannocystis exedens]|nr:tetratricopeptide repeat protein [Nannocystis exedens]
MKRFIPSLVTASLLLTGPIVPSLAQAAGPAAEESFATLTEQASEKYTEGDYDGSIALFERAYALNPEPNILFNIGRIYEEAGNYEDAIVYYERFISEPQVDLEAKQVALDRRDLAQAVVDIQNKDKKGKEPPPETTTEPTETEPTDPVVPVTDPPSTEEPVEETAPKKPRNLRPVGYVLLGTGAAALIGGVVVGGLAKGEERKFQAATNKPDADAAKARGTKLAPAADGLFIAGGLLATAGIVMLLVPRRGKNAQRRERAMFVPHASPTQVGFGVIGRF